MLRQNLDDLDTNGKKGDWCFLNNDGFIAIRFGEDVFTGTTIIPILKNEVTQRAWCWNGSKESPTLSPSILVHKSHYSNGWHGFLTNGELVNA